MKNTKFNHKDSKFPNENSRKNQESKQQTWSFIQSKKSLACLQPFCSFKTTHISLKLSFPTNEAITSLISYPPSPLTAKALTCFIAATTCRPYRWPFRSSWRYFTICSGVLLIHLGVCAREPWFLRSWLRYCALALIMRLALSSESGFLEFLDLGFGLVGSLPSLRDHGSGVTEEEEEWIVVLGFVDEGDLLEGKSGIGSGMLVRKVDLKLRFRESICFTVYTVFQCFWVATRCINGEDNVLSTLFVWLWSLLQPVSIWNFFLPRFLNFFYIYPQRDNFTLFLWLWSGFIFYI